MMIVPAGVKVHLALGYTDMRKGMDGLAMLVQETLKKDPFSGHLFAFRGKRAQIVKVLFWDGNGLCLFTKRLDRGGFVWPRMVGHEGSITCLPRSSHADRRHRLARAGAHLEACSCRLKQRRNPHRI